jgi:hypothetical protein
MSATYPQVPEMVGGTFPLWLPLEHDPIPTDATTAAIL